MLKEWYIIVYVGGALADSFYISARSANEADTLARQLITYRYDTLHVQEAA